MVYFLYKIFRKKPKFEFDPAKSHLNKKKHGIDFVEAQMLWEDKYSTESSARSDVENRFIVIGMIREKHYTACITYRDEVIRIISVRRAREKEVADYEHRKIR